MDEPVQELPEYVQNLQIELSQVSEKILKLENISSHPIYPSLTDQEKRDMNLQKDYMLLYGDVLARRITYAMKKLRGEIKLEDMPQTRQEL